MCCSMQAVGRPFAQTKVFKTLAKEVAAFYRDYVEPGKKNSKDEGWVVGFELMMENIKTWTELGEDGRRGRFKAFDTDKEMAHFSTAFLYLMRFTFRPASGNANDVYHDNFVSSLKMESWRCRAWFKVLEAMWHYLHAVESRDALEHVYLNEVYMWCQGKLELLQMGRLV